MKFLKSFSWSLRIFLLNFPEVLLIMLVYKVVGKVSIHTKEQYLLTLEIGTAWNFELFISNLFMPLNSEKLWPFNPVKLNNGVEFERPFSWRLPSVQTKSAFVKRYFLLFSAKKWWKDAWISLFCGFQWTDWRWQKMRVCKSHEYFLTLVATEDSRL